MDLHAIWYTAYMQRIATHWYIFIALVLVAMAVYMFAPVSAKTSSAREVRWLLSHQPSDVFARAAQIFAEELTRESDGSLKLVLLTPEDIGVTGEDVSHARVLEAFTAAEADLASVYTVPMSTAYPDLRVLNLPFLFSNYDEVLSMLGGSAAEALLRETGGDVRGLAFTMSGGFRIIAAKDAKIESADDFKGLRIGTSGGSVAEETLRALGAIPVSMDPDTGTTDGVSTLDGVETTYARLSAIVGSDSEYTTVINETNHSVFLTAIIANGTFYDSLTENERRALHAAALAAARVEREDSVALNASTKEELARQGSTIVEITVENRDALKQMTQGVHAIFNQTFGLAAENFIQQER